ncbi:MAG: ABC transporter ATP-binding protein [Spirochaetia bacterium]
MEERCILEVRGASFAYGEARPVLKGLSFRLHQGSIAAILGPNGSGKSTLLDICLGWKKPSSGQVLLAGRPLGAWTRSERGRMMSLVPQRENVRFDFSALDYVLLGRAPHLGPLQAPGSRDRAVALEALASAGIAPLAKRPVTTLSGGEYQLMLIARSLAQQASLLLLDEPASQLDPAHQLRVMRLLRTLSRRGITVLFTSHSPQAAATIADTISLLKGGRFRFSGPAREVLTAANLRSLYGVPFRAAWSRGIFSCAPIESSPASR